MAKTRGLNFRVTDDDARRLDELARQARVSRSEALRILLASAQRIEPAAVVRRDAPAGAEANG